ncbi:MAG: hypothetical protein FD123_3012 [Bacteroidetes bacterium]|nr:MAG: hypothetical protein FD123_3012 [Bacteroidota bacterium]
MKRIFRLVPVSFGILLTCSCGGEATLKTDSTKTAAADSLLVKTDSLPVKPAFRTVSPFYFEPDTSVIEGIIETEMHWGPPGYGEDTLNDMREEMLVISLDKKIDVLAPEKGGDSFNETVKGIDRVQLANMTDKSLEKYAGKKVRLTGCFFGAHTGHHHTPVLMAVSRAEKQDR